MVDLESIVGRLEGRLGTAAGDPVPLEGGITNRNFRVRLGEREYVIRVPGKDTALLGISREAERLAGETAAALHIGPDVAAADDACLVTSYLGGAPLDAQGVRDRVNDVAGALSAFHDSGIALPARFWVPDLLDTYALVVHERGARLPDAYGYAQEIVRLIGRALPLQQPVPCHNDLLPANLLSVDGDRIAFVDWEYAGMGHPMFDLGNLAVNSDFDDAAEERLLAAYFHGAQGPATKAALKLMRLMSDAREGAWGVVQSVISELDFDFTAYAERHFDRLSTAAADARFEEWLRAAAA